MKTTKITVELLSGTTLAIHPDNYYRHPLLYNVCLLYTSDAADE